MNDQLLSLEDAVGDILQRLQALENCNDQLELALARTTTRVMDLENRLDGLD